jgi:hypothetical protein
MIAKPRELSQQILRTLVLVSALVVIMAVFLWWSTPVKGQLQGYAQVNRLELGYVPGNQSLQARISLVTGPSLTYEASTDKDFDALFKIAQVFGQRGTRMFVMVKDDQIKSFQLSIP